MKWTATHRKWLDLLCAAIEVASPTVHIKRSVTLHMRHPSINYYVLYYNYDYMFAPYMGRPLCVYN